MIKRIEDAIANRRTLIDGDASFYMHEITEYTIMNGVYNDAVYKAAHDAALEKYRVSPYSVYAAEVVDIFKAYFNQNWLDFWGIPR